MTGTELATRDPNSVSRPTVELARTVPTTPWIMRIEEHSSWETLAQLRMTIRVGVPLKYFRVRDLLAIESGQVFESLSSSTEDVPVTIGQVQIGWSEFEVVDMRMALRLTRLG
jgi:hypothetical protein